MDAMSPQQDPSDLPVDTTNAETINADQETGGLAPAREDQKPRLSAKKEDELLLSFKKKFTAWKQRESAFLTQFPEDVKFAHADSVNNWQWDELMVSDRTDGDQPCMTINQVRLHNALIVNEVRRNPPSIQIKPTGLGASGKSADVVGGLFREIQRDSGAVNIYVKATEWLVEGGVGYWRVITKHESDESFDQVFRIESVASALSAGLDINVKEPDGSDANWGFIYEDVPNEDLEEEYPSDEDEVGKSNAVLGTDAPEPRMNWGADSWRFEKTTRVCEWYQREYYTDKLVGWISEQTGKEVTQFASKIDKEVLSALLRDRLTRVRTVRRSRIMWYKVVGDAIVDFHPVPGQYIPIVRVEGETTFVDGVLDRKGMTRVLMDVQRNMNYWTSAAAEQVALTTKVPWVGPAMAFEGHPEWTDANRKNYAYLPYNHKDDEDQPLPAPQRGTPAQMAQAYIDGLKIAVSQMNDISGQHEAKQGQPGDEKSGKAINAQKMQGDVATYHFPDAIAMGVAYTGKIMLSGLAEVYDTERMIRITNPDGTQAEVTLDPTAPAAHQEVPKGDEEDTKEVILNPTLGSYNVEAESGPDYATQRQWAVDALTQILSANKELWSIFGDIAVQNMDFPGSTEIAERLRRTINPAVLGEGPSPGEQAAQAQITQMSKLIETFVQTISELQTKLENKDEELTIKAVDAETRRISTIGNAQENFEEAGLSEPFNRVAMETLGNAVNDPDPSALAEAHDAENEPVHPDAEVGPDGNQYVNHPDHGRLRYVPEEPTGAA